jgi:hypothetical protein
MFLDVVAVALVVVTAEEEPGEESTEDGVSPS